jgi:hypothetical protein
MATTGSLHSKKEAFLTREFLCGRNFLVPIIDGNNRVVVLQNEIVVKIKLFLIH